MIDWNQLTLFLFILMRMSGFVLFNPLLGQRSIPGYFKTGLILVLTLSVSAVTTATVVVPTTFLAMVLKLLLELSMGFLVALVMNIFFSITQLAGEAIDTQMGMTMSKTYDAAAQASLTVTASFLNLLMMLLFFAANGHHTLLRLMMTSGELVPFGAAALGNDVLNCVVELFLEAMILSVKLCLPVLAAELMGQVGVGILMKVIPQINVFSINIELKVVIGLLMLLILVAPFSEYLLVVEATMLSEIRRVLSLVG